MVLRMLLKIGLEVMAARDPTEVFRDRYNPTRQYALHGLKSFPWFYIEKDDHVLQQRYINGEEWEDHHCFIDVHYEDDGLVYLHMRTYYIEFLVPLVEQVIIDPSRISSFDEKIITI